MSRKIFPIYRIDFGKKRHIAQQDRRLHHLVETGARCREDGPEIMHDLMRFGDDIGGIYLACRRFNGYLAGDEQQVAGHYGLAIGPDRSGRVRSVDDLVFHYIAKIGEICGQTGTRMKIAAITQHYSEEDLGPFYPGAGIDWIILKDVPAPGRHEGVAVYLDLDFANDPQRTQALSRLLPALIIINAVVPTIAEIGHPFVRFNGWPGWPERAVHELVAPDEPTAARITDLYARLGHTFRLVPDTTGMISPRILAAIINEAWYTWQEKVSTKEEIDTAMRLGTNYPHGPFEWGQRIGIGAVSDLLWSLSRTDVRYIPCKALQEARLKCD